ncbi:MAG TPA: hypothetical protein VFL83_17630 [Anaeromyxobacter sp.]|nr:hypothetical protein [Anaeromyxobacter sp.]
MRFQTPRILLPLALALALVAGCKKEGVEGPAAQCLPVSYPCSYDSQCCSYGCIGGSCRPNPLEGGACRTSDDCQYPRVCVGATCTASVSCRNGGSSCVSGSDCCSGQCATGGQCTQDLPPVAQAGADVLPDQPFRIPIHLDGSASTDPNTGSTGLLYEWTVSSAPAGSTAAPTPPGVVNPTFTPDVADGVVPYVLQLRVTKGGLSSTDTVTFRAVNTVPVITMPADVAAPAYQSRNVPLTFSATVSDADGGPITCSWSKTNPLTAETTVVVAPYVCAGASGVAATGSSPFTLNEDQAGSWRLTLTATDDGGHTVTRDRYVNVENDPPVANAGPRRYGNYDLGAVPLAGTATDVNGDVTGGNVGDATFTWLWTVTGRPAGSAINLGTEVGRTPNVSFTPDAEGVFQLTLTVDDGHGGLNGDSDTATVEVQVDPYILPLGEVADAEYVDGTNQIVLVETGAGNAYALKIVDPATLRVIDEVALSARPTCVGLNPLGTEALVGEAGGIFQRVTGIAATPNLAVATTGSGMTADLADAVHAGACAYGLTGAGTLYRLNATATAAPWFDLVTCPNCTAAATPPSGTRGTATATDLWLLQTSTGRLGRYIIQENSNCNLRDGIVSTYGALQGSAGLWRSADDADLYTTRTSVYAAADLAQRVTTSLPFTPDHLDTTLSAGSLVGAVARYATTALSPFSRGNVGTPFVAAGDVAYPILGFNGDAIQNYGRFAFVRSGGGAYYAIVRANVGTVAAPVYRWGLVNLAP